MFLCYKRLFAFTLLALGSNTALHAMEVEKETEKTPPLDQPRPGEKGVYPEMSQQPTRPYSVYAQQPQQRPVYYEAEEQKQVIILPIATVQNKLSVLLGLPKNGAYWTAVGGSPLILPDLEGSSAIATTQGPILAVVPVNDKDPEKLRTLLSKEDKAMQAFAWFPLDTIQTKMTIPSIPVPSQGNRLALMDPQIHALIKSNISEIKTEGAKAPLPSRKEGGYLSPIQYTLSGLEGKEEDYPEEEIPLERFQTFHPSAERGKSYFGPSREEQQQQFVSVNPRQSVQGMRLPSQQQTKGSGQGQQSYF